MSKTRKNMHGGVARPKRFLRRHHSSRRPSGLQGISTDRKSRFLSRKMSMHPHHSVHHNQSRPNVSMKQARKPRGSKKANNQKIKYAKAYNHELHFNNAIKQSRVGEQASARASRASRGREGRHMNNGSASAASSSAKGRRSSWFPKRGEFHRELSAAASHNGHAAAASSGPRDPRDLLASQESQE